MLFRAHSGFNDESCQATPGRRHPALLAAGLPIIYGSVCSGIEAMTVAWESLAFRPAWLAEINPIGNSMAVPVMRWIGRRIQMADGIRG
ncbi:MAG: hypothetical protein M1570_12160 [Chloroflexi bacterium]|nr:hypothetical protein [Chloroflexota bacterium]